MTEISTTKKGSKQADDKNRIRPFQKINIPEAELTELRRRINNTRWPERETVTDATQGAGSWRPPKHSRAIGRQSPRLAQRSRRD